MHQPLNLEPLNPALSAIEMPVFTFLVLVLAWFAGGEVIAVRNCSLDGQWYDKASTRTAQLVFR